jgi:hypothetical protein
MKRWLSMLVLVACSGKSTPPPQPPENTPAIDAAAETTAAADCTADSDCEIYCPEAEGCCTSSACGCDNAIPRTDHAKLDADYAKSCERIPDCPVYDCAYNQVTGARCDSGRCVPTTGPTGP